MFSIIAFSMNVIGALLNRPMPVSFSASVLWMNVAVAPIVLGEPSMLSVLVPLDGIALREDVIDVLDHIPAPVAPSRLFGARS
jgi:hypothetical protein